VSNRAQIIATKTLMPTLRMMLRAYPLAIVAPSPRSKGTL
jgi:hypothetical protein